MTPTPQLQVEEPGDQPRMVNEALEVRYTTISVEGSAILGKIYLWNASSSEHGAETVKPAVYPFKCREWDLATAGRLRIEESRRCRAPVGLPQRERIAFPRTGTEYVG